MYLGVQSLDLVYAHILVYCYVSDSFIILFYENAGYCVLARSWVLVTYHLYQFDGCEVIPRYGLN